MNLTLYLRHGEFNDINMLYCSQVLSRLAERYALAVHYEINGHEYNKCYYLTDGIYPGWPTLVKTIYEPIEEKNKCLPNKRGL
jgi:hypothetical protein